VDTECTGPIIDNDDDKDDDVDDSEDQEI